MHTINKMITADLGYCCTAMFYSRYRDNEMIAARLGVTSRGVRKARLKAEQCERCWVAAKAKAAPPAPPASC